MQVSLCEPRRELPAAVPSVTHVAADPFSAEAATRPTAARNATRMTLHGTLLSLPGAPFGALTLGDVLLTLRQQHRDLAIGYSRRILQALLEQLPSPVLRAVLPPSAGLYLPLLSPAEVCGAPTWLGW